MKRTTSLVLVFCMLLGLLSFGVSADASSTQREIQVQTMAISGDATVTVTWDDAWFTEPATSYNHALAITAMAFAGATYVDLQPDAITKALQNAGFGDVESHYETPTLEAYDIVSYVFGRKTLSDGSDLFAIIIKGTSSSEEWLSNFNVGTSGTHAGFQKAADALLTNFQSYYAKSGATVQTAKILVAGHSRGAAVANDVAASLSKDQSLALRSHVYGYTFATPTVSDTATATGFDNIYNIVSADDFITRVPLHKWGFHRYGVDMVLPTKSYCDSAYYQAAYTRMTAAFLQLTGSDYRTFHMGVKKIDDVVDACYSLAEGIEPFYNVAYTYAQNSEMTLHDYFVLLSESLYNPSAQTSARYAATAVGPFATLTRGLLLTGADGQATLLNAHDPGAYYAWLSANDADALFGSGNYMMQTGSTMKRAVITGNVDVYVVRGDTLVGHVVNGKIVNDTMAIYTDNGTTVLDVPDGASYTIELRGAGKSVLNYCVEEMVMGSGQCDTTRTISFAPIQIEEGSVIRTTLDGVFNGPADAYQIMLADGSIVRGSSGDALAASVTISFTDVDESSPYYTAITLAVERGIITGYPDGSFRPENTLTRAEACAIISRLLEGDTTGYVSSFQDVQSHWSEPYVGFCEAQNLVAGYGDGKFGPNDTLTGAAWAKMLLCSLGVDAAQSGLLGSAWDAVASALAGQLGLLEGLTGVQLDAPITREQAIQMAYNSVMRLAYQVTTNR